MVSIAALRSEDVPGLANCLTRNFPCIPANSIGRNWAQPGHKISLLYGQKKTFRRVIADGPHGDGGEGRVYSDQIPVIRLRILVAIPDISGPC